MLTVDIFVHHPIPFPDLSARAERVVIADVPVYICSIDDLIALKQQAGRPQDLINIEKLRRIQEKNVANAKPAPEEEHLWPVTWDEVKEAELDDALRATPAQRLARLEEALRLAWKAGAIKRHES